MSISLFSIAVLFLTAAFVLFEISRAIKKGFYATLVRVCVVLLSVVLSFIAAKPISDLFVKIIYDPVMNMGLFDSLLELLPSVGDIVFAYCDAIITPFVFVLVFPLMILVVKFVAYIIKSKNEDFGKDDGKVRRENAEWIDKHQKLLAIAVSAVCGIFMASVFISPLMGSLKMAGKVVSLGAELSGDNSNLDMNVSGIEQGISKYKNDPVANLVYYCGGNVVYYANAASELNGSYFTLRREIKNTVKYYNEILSSAKLIGRIESATRSEVENLKNIEKYINKSETLKTVASDFVAGISGSWLEGESYMGLEKPEITSAVNPVLNKVLYVCSQTKPKYVAKDMGTLIDLYVLFRNSGIMGSSNYEEMISLIDDTGFIDKVSAILKENPRMSGISLDFDNMTVSIISAALLSDAISNREFSIIAGDIADAVNGVRHLPREEQIFAVTDSAYRAINDSSIDVPYDVVKKTAEKLVDDISVTKGDITKDTIENFFEKYSADYNSN